MKNIYLFTLLLLCSELLFANQPPSNKNNKNTWQTLTTGMDYRAIKRHYAADTANGIEPRKVILHAFRIKQGAFEVKTHSFHALTDQQKTSVRDFRQQQKALMVLSGGFFQSSFRDPVGLVVEQGKQLFPIAKSLSGVIWIKDGQLHLTPTKRFKKQAIKADYAIQGYPRIVDPINKRGIQTQRTLFVHRAAICAVKDHFIVLISDKKFAGLSLYELATIAQAKEADNGLACDIAINLDGGPAPALSVDEKIMPLEVQERIGWQVPNVVVVSSKTKQ